MALTHGTSTVAFILVMLLSQQGPASASTFMGPRTSVDPAYVQMLVRGALNTVLGSGHGVDILRLTDINATIVPLFQALPKNGQGRLGVPLMRYVVQRFFSQRHGWIIKGFEPYADNKFDVALGSGHILDGKIAGHVESILEKTFDHGGFSLHDTTVAIAAVEALIFNDNIKGLEAAYNMMQLGAATSVESMDQLESLLISYFIIEHLHGDAADPVQHKFDKDNIADFYDQWHEMLAFLKDMVLEDGFLHSHFVNPFAEQMTYSFEDVSRMTRRISEHYGKFSNFECHHMKTKLAKMDMHGTGRVRLSDFYASSVESGSEFLETREYLAAIGALDNSSSSLGDQVIIPNYIVGPNNCISSSLYYEVCCLNECDGIYQHIEAKVGKPFASAAEIQSAVEGGITLAPVLSSSAPTEARNLSTVLLAQLGKVAAHHDDKIPLHGRLFAQWLHFAYPRECPFPHRNGSLNVQRVEELKKKDKDVISNEKELDDVIASLPGQVPHSPEAGLLMWTMEEELLEPFSTEQSEFRFQTVVRSAVHIVLILCFAAVTLKELTRLRHVQNWGNLKKADPASGPIKSSQYYV